MYFMVQSFWPRTLDASSNALHASLSSPSGICPTTDGWRAHFDKLWQQRNLWKVDETATAKARQAAPTITKVAIVAALDRERRVELARG